MRPLMFAAYLFPLGSYLISILLYRAKVDGYGIRLGKRRTKKGRYLPQKGTRRNKKGNYLIWLGSYLFSSDKRETEIHSLVLACAQFDNGVRAFFLQLRNRRDAFALGDSEVRVGLNEVGFLVGEQGFDIGDAFHAARENVV